MYGCLIAILDPNELNTGSRPYVQDDGFWFVFKKPKTKKTPNIFQPWSQ